MDNFVIVSTIAGYIDTKIPQALSLSQVNRTFYEVFTADQMWKRFDVYNVKQGIYRHFINAKTQGEKEWEQTGGLVRVLNKYDMLESPLVSDRIAGPLLADAHSLRIAVAYDPKLYLELDGDYLNDKQLAKNAICNQHPHHFAIESHFRTLSPLAQDREFCLEAIDGPWGNPNGGNLLCFSEKFSSDIGVFRIAAKWHPEVVLLFNPITKQFIDEFVPTEDDFLPMINDYGKYYLKFIDFYNSPRVLYTALVPDDYELIVTVCRGRSENDQYDPVNKAALECYMNPEMFNELNEDFKANPYLVALVLSSPGNRKVLETYDQLSGKLKSNKNIIAAVLSQFKLEDNFLLEHLPQKETQQVLADPYYAQRLVMRNVLLFSFIKVPITEELTQILIHHQRKHSYEIQCSDEMLLLVEEAVRTFCELSDTTEEILNHIELFRFLTAPDLDISGCQLGRFQTHGVLLAVLIRIATDPGSTLVFYSHFGTLFNDEAKQDPRVLEYIFGELQQLADGKVSCDTIELKNHVTLVKPLKQENTKKRVKELEASGKLDAGIYEKVMDFLDKVIHIEQQQPTDNAPKSQQRSQAAKLTSVNTAPQRAQQQQPTGNPPKSQEKDKGCCVIA